PSTPAAAPTPTAPAAPTPAPTTTTVSVCSGDTVNAGIGSQGGNCSTNTTTVQTPPTTPTSPTPTPSAPVATPAAAVVAQPAALVYTGPGNIVALFGIATVGGYFIHRKLMQRAF
ncbi:MAG TPA: hypothetical protein VH234_05765, partial [Candidatus Saccharimonadales bacterium]|nr:hypothetical protein [Candidatus Saccharimonadales bacterium]